MGFTRCAGSVASIKDVSDCMKAAALGLTPVDNLPWKLRYMEQHLYNKPSLALEEGSGSPTSPGDAAYGVSGRKAKGQDLLKDMFYDPRLGRMVRSDGSDVFLDRG